MKKVNIEKIDMKKLENLLNTLINANKIKFSFYNNSLLDLDLLQMCYNKKDDTLELKFRDVMGERIQELKEIMDDR